MSRRRPLAILAAAAVVVAATAVVAVAAVRPPAPRDEPVEVGGYRLLGPDRLQLGYNPVTVHCGGGPLHAPEVTETSSTVEIGLTQTVTDIDGPCILVAQIGRVEITLGAPLGRRSVIDASTGRVVPAGLASTPFD